MINLLINFVSEVNIEFDKDFIKICSLDSTKTCLLWIKIKQSDMNDYKCHTPKTVGFNLVALKNGIRSLNSNSFTFKMDDDGSNKYYMIKETNGGFIQFSGETLNLYNNIVNLPQIQVDVVVTVHSSFTLHFKDKFIDNIHNTIIKVDQKNIYFVWKNENYTKMTKLTDNIAIDNEDNITLSNIYETYKLKKFFDPRIKFGQTFSLYLKKEYPLVITGKIGKFQIKFAFSPLSHEQNNVDVSDVIQTLAVKAESLSNDIQEFNNQIENIDKVKKDNTKDNLIINGDIIFGVEI